MARIITSIGHGLSARLRELKLWPGARERKVFGVEPWRERCYRIIAVTLSGESVRRVGRGKIVTSETWKTTLNEMGYRAGMETVLALPRRDAVLKWVKVPTTDERQIAQLVPHEARACVPWPPEDCATAYQILRSDAEGYTRILLLVVRHETVMGHLRQLKELGIAPTRVELSALCLGRLLANPENSSHLAIVAIGPDTFEYLRLHNGEPAFSRGIELPEHPLATLEETLELDMRRNRFDPANVNLLVASGFEEGPQSSVRVGDLSVPLKFINDILHVSVLNGAGSLSPADTVCAGAALGAHLGSSTTDLLPVHEARTAALRALMKETLLLAILIAWLALVLLGIGRHYFSAEQKRAARAEQEIAVLEKEVGDLVAKNDQLALLADERNKVSLPLRVALELYERTPYQIAINQMRYDARGSLVLSGEATTYGATFSYAENLGKSSYFRNVEVQYGSQHKSGGTNLVEFQVTCKIASAVDK